MHSITTALEVLIFLSFFLLKEYLSQTNLNRKRCKSQVIISHTHRNKTFQWICEVSILTLYNQVFHESYHIVVSKRDLSQILRVNTFLLFFPLKIYPSWRKLPRVTYCYSLGFPLKYWKKIIDPLHQISVLGKLLPLTWMKKSK